MCGIFAYVGQQNAVEVVKNNLSKLQYRGYDSAGIGWVVNDALKMMKTVGTSDNIYCDETSSIAIGHTRWATHGNVCIENAHPFITQDGSMMIVHNGIIENYRSLKAALVKKGYTFTSQTDTEVMLALIHSQSGDVLTRISSACSQLKGAYAFVLLAKDTNMMYATKNGNPLYVAQSGDNIYISSDSPALAEYSNIIFAMDNNEIAEINNKTLKFFGPNGTQTNKSYHTITTGTYIGDKSGYSHYMLKEIFDTPQSLLNTNIDLDEEKLSQVSQLLSSKKYNHIHIVGCGTAYHAGLVGVELFSSIGLNVNCYLASEYKYSNRYIGDDCLVIYISQSGETADTIGCAERTRSMHCHNMCITNVESSSITRLCDTVVYTRAGSEIAVASTKAYSTQLLTLCQVYHFLINKSKIPIIDIINPVTIILNNTDNIKKIAKMALEYDKIFFIGRGLDFCVAQEASLKLKEVTYLPCQACAGGELKHGTLSLIDDNCIVFVLDTQYSTRTKIENAVHEISARGGKIVRISPEKSMTNVLLPCIQQECLYPIVAAITLQLLAYYVSTSLGYDPDRPRNLAKSVTVE